MNSRRPSSLFRGIGTIMALTALVMGVQYFSGGAVSHFFSSAAGPVQNMVAAAGATASAPFTMSTEAKAAQISYEALRAEVLRLADVELQNAQLREIIRSLKLLTPVEGVYTENTVVMPVYAHAGSLPYGTLTIARTEGAYPVGAVVFGNNGIAIGVVTAVYAQSAQVQLLSSVGEQFAAVVEDAEENALTLEVQGYGHGNFTAEAPRDAAIVEGRMVYSARVQGAPIAVVAALEGTPSDPVQTVRMHVPFNIDALRFVRVQTAL